MRSSARPDVVYLHSTAHPTKGVLETLTAGLNPETGVLHIVGPYPEEGESGALRGYAARARERAAARGKGRPDSGSERRLIAALGERGIEVEIQRPVDGAWLDAAYEEGDVRPIRLDIEVDGRPFHEGPDGELRKRDRDRNERMRKLGWIPVRFWSDDVDEDAAAIAERVQKRIEQERAR